MVDSKIGIIVIVKLVLIVIGKTQDAYLKEGIAKYTKRLSKYISFEHKEISELKGNYDSVTQKRKEGEELLKLFPEYDYIILLDESGENFTSISFADFVQKRMNASHKQVAFVIGGSYGFSDEVYNAASKKISLSKMTFSHQMVRLFFVEQLYRSFTILNNEPYHHN